MRILIASPIPTTAIGGPASIARTLKQELEQGGDTVEIVTLNSIERTLPPPARQFVLFLRAIFLCVRVDAVLLLDPASTGMSFALAAKVTGKPVTLRVGGDFLWETFVERTQEAVLLSEFYTKHRSLSTYEKLIREATRLTLSLSDRIVFTTPWIRDIWMKPFNLERKNIDIISNPVGERVHTEEDTTATVFLAAGRGTRVKNLRILKEEVWPRVVASHPDAILDVQPKSGEEYRAALKSAYALIIPTLSEVSPNSMLEAIQYGKPFISTIDNGLYEQYKDAGLFIDTRNVEAFEAAINELLDASGYQRAIAKVQIAPKGQTVHEMAQAFRTVLMG